MKKSHSSFLKQITSGESCAICAVVVTILSVVVIWQVIAMLHGQVQDFAALQDIGSWRR